MKIKLYCTLWITLFFLVSKNSNAQEALNQTDNQGERHGPWKVFFDNNKKQPKFEGTFDHGKRVGLFKFYQEGLKQPVATMLFDTNSDTVKVKYLAQNGKTISEGQMLDQKRIGTWKYYHKNPEKIMMIEHYKNGLLDGEKITYYDNGQVAEKAFYKDGKLEGERKLYSVKGVVLEHLHYENGELHGPAKFYNGRGQVQSEGSYKRDRHHGIWKYYENGKLKEEKDFSSN